MIPSVRRNALSSGARNPLTVAVSQRFMSDAPAKDKAAFYPRRAQLGGPLSIKHGGRAQISGIVATVFGATGFIGRYSVANLGAIGSQVIVPYRGDGENARHLKLAGDLGQIVPIPVQLWDDEALRRSVARSNVVVNLVGGRHNTQNYDMHDANVKTAHRIAKFSAEAGVERFIQVSAIGADKDSDSKWLASKAEAEEVARDYFPQSTILRLAPVYGEDDAFLNNLADLLRMTAIIPVIDGGQARVQPVWAGDVASAITQAIVLPEAVGQTYYLGGSKVLTQRELIDLVAEMIFKADTTVGVPLALAQWFGRVNEVLTSSRRRRYSSDMAVESTLDMVVPEGAPGLADLLVRVNDFELEASSLLWGQRGVRGESVSPRPLALVGPKPPREYLES